MNHIKNLEALAILGGFQQYDQGEVSTESYNELLELIDRKWKSVPCGDTAQQMVDKMIIYLKESM